jgi:hypothetical protein
MKPVSAIWRVGQRVTRVKPEAIGTVVEVDGRLKVKWDTGATSYYNLDQSPNIAGLNPRRLSKAASLVPIVSLSRWLLTGRGVMPCGPLNTTNCKQKRDHYRRLLSASLSAMKVCVELSKPLMEIKWWA